MHTDEQLWKLVDGELPAAEAEAVEQAARTDAALQSRIDRMRTIKREVTAGAPAPPPDFADRVVALAARPVFDLAEARRVLRRALVAAAILAALGIAYFAVEVGPDLVGPSNLQANPLLGD